MQKIKGAFTLFEIILVVLLIGVMYGLFLGKIKAPKSESINEVKQIKKGLAKLYPFEKSALICLEECKECVVYHENNATKQQWDIFKSEPEIYRFDQNGYLEEAVFNPVYDKRGDPMEVCLRFDRYKNGSSSRIAIRSEDVVYFFLPMFDEPLEFSSLDEVKTYYNTVDSHIRGAF